MRVLHINSNIYTNSGVMSVVMNYYRHIDRNLVQFDFLYLFPIDSKHKTYEREIKELGGKTFYAGNFRNVISFNNKLKEIIKNNDYKTVHVHDPFAVNLIYRTLKQGGVKNIIVHSHATKWSDKFINGIRNRFLCAGLTRKANHLCACSKAAGDFMFGKNKSFYVMNNAIDLDRYVFNEDRRKLIREELGILDKIVFGSVANICLQKNHDFLVDIFNEINKLNSNTILLLVGDGVLREKIELKIKRLKLEDSVIFVGIKKNVEDYYSCMDCIVMPSLYEGLPMVGVEAQCSGLPVIFSDTITKEVGAEFSCYMSLKKPAKDWAVKAIELCNNKISRENGKKFMAKIGFDIIEQAHNMEKYYIEMQKE